MENRRTLSGRGRHGRARPRLLVALAVLLTSLPMIPPGVSSRAAAGTGNVLVVVAHPDDEALAAAGIIAAARSAGRRVYVAITTNGDSRAGTGGATYCGTDTAQHSNVAQFGLLRDGETITAMGVLGLTWTNNASTSDIFFLGYPDQGVRQVANSGANWTGDPTGLNRTYADDRDGSTATCNGDLRFLLSGRHSNLTAADMAADFESLLAKANPTDIYTHASFDGHTDHAEVNRQVVAAAQRKGMTTTVHATLVHPEGTEGCDALSAYQWPNPAIANNDPYARFTPTIDVIAPPTPTCSSSPTSTSWGSAGPPDEFVTVPADMQLTSETTNRKWQVLSKYVSQVDCTPGGTYPAACGFMRAFVKKREFFWTTQISPPAPPPANTFGVTSVGPLLDQPATGYKFGSIQTLSAPATFVDFKFYARGGSAAQSFVPVVYNVDASGNPTSLAAQGAEVTVAAGSVAGWRTSALPVTSVPAGRYVLALLAGTATASATLYYNSVANGGIYNANAYPTPTSSWGAVNLQSSQHSFYVDYQPSAVDTQKPVTSITAPTTGSTVSGTTVVNATATDNVAVTKVDFLVDGAVANTDTASPWAFTWDSSTVTNGSHALVAKAYDAAGNVGTSATVTVTVNNVGPRTFGGTTAGPVTDQPGAGYRFGSTYTLFESAVVSTFSFYARGGTASQNLIPVLYNVDASDTPTNLVAQGAQVTIAANAAASWQTSALPSMTIPAGRYVLALLSGPNSGGSYLYYTSVANAGVYNANAYPTPASTWGPVNKIAAQYSFYVSYQPAAADTQVPTVSITAPAAGATVSGTSTVTANATDNTAVTKVEFLVDAILTSTDTTSPYSFPWDTTAATNGAHTLLAKAYDVAGNVGTSAAVNVTVTNTAPLAFGGTTAGTQTDAPGTGYRFGSIYALSGPANLIDFKFYARGGSSSQNFIPVIYNVDAGGSPTNLVAQGAEVTVAANAAAGWQTSALPASTLTPGNYLLTILSGPNSSAATIYFTAQTGGGMWAANSYPTPASTWGPVNLGNARYSFYVDYQTPPPDTQRPTASITNPVGGATVSSVVDIAATATDNLAVTKVEFSIDGTLVGTDTTSPYSYAWSTTAAANGAHTLVAKAYDAAGNTGISPTVSVTVSNTPPPLDSTPPTVSITAPAAGSTVTGTVAVNATAADNVAVTKVDFLVDGSQAATNTTSPYAYNWDSTTVANGSHTLTAKAYDAAGNVGSATVTVTVSNVASRTFGGTAAGPQTDQPGDGYRFGSIYTVFEAAVLTDFRFYARGGNSSQSFVPTLYNVGANGVPTSLVAQGAQVTVGANAAAAWQTSALPPTTIYPGNYMLAIVAGPASGGAVVFFTAQTDGGMYNPNAFPTPAATWGPVNWVNARYSFYVDYQPAAPDTQNPVVSITAPSNGATVSGTTSVTATATDNAAVTKVEFLIDGVVASTDTTSPYAHTWDTGAASNGSHALTAKAYDISGNVGTSATVTVNVNNVPDTQSPTVSIVSPANGATVSNVTTITATAADNVSVTRVEFLIDGVLKSTVLASPYNYAWDTSTATTGSHTLVAKAYDSPGNVGTSTAVTVNNVTAGPTISDDFSGPLNTTRWTFVDPLGDSSVSVNGSQAVISVAAGPAHYVWTGGAQAPRLMQTVANGDFELEAKFQSSLSAQTQLQGILIEQDANNFVRFDISQENCKTQIAGATVAGASGTGWFVRDVRGGADVYMRVKRVGSNWTLSYSYDGQSWTTSGTFNRALTVTRVGPFGGNSGPGGGPAPAFTAKVDYFVNRASPPSTEDGSPFVPPPAAPLIDIWYGDNQTFGQNGRPQQWVNVLGRVSDTDGISSLTYSLNGGADQILSMGENAVRLVAPGDFNVELDYNSLNAGANTVRIKAVDSLGTTSTHTVTVNSVTGVTTPANYSVDWSNASSINSVAQISDGRWQLLPDGTVRTTEIGYDRLIELGDMSAWTNYDVSANVTIWNMPCGGASVGLVTGWTGHTTNQYGVPAPDQPRIGHPFPAFGSYLLSPGQAPRLSIGANTAAHQEAELAADPTGKQLTLGVPYVFKLRTQTNAVGSHFSFKVWRVGTPEPGVWDLQADGDRSQGAVVLAAHGGDATFGAVTVTGL